MRGSTFTTFLVFLPLIAIPVLAVFGIPEFTPVNASSPTEAGGVTIRDLESATNRQPAEPKKDAAKKTEEIFSPLPAGKNDFQIPVPGSQGQSPDPFLTGDRNRGSGGNTTRSRFNGWEVAPRRSANDDARNTREQPHIELPKARPTPKKPDPKKAEPKIEAAPFPGTMLTSDRQPRPANNGFASKSEIRSQSPPSTTFEDFAAKMRQMEITNYTVRHNADTRTFHIVCFTSPRGSNRVMVRFDAEHAEFAAAAQTILKRIEARRGTY